MIKLNALKEMAVCLVIGFFAGILLALLTGGLGTILWGRTTGLIVGRNIVLISGAVVFIYSGVRMFTEEGAAADAGLFRFGKATRQLDDELQERESKKKFFFTLKKKHIGLLLAPGMLFVSLLIDCLIRIIT